MKIDQTHEQLVELGARYRSGYLMEQYGYTNGLAVIEGSPLAALLAVNFLAETKIVADKVEAFMNDKTLLESEAKDATQAQNKALQLAKVWRRRVAMRAMSASRLGAGIPDGLSRMTRAQSVPAMANSIDGMIKLLTAHATLLAGPDIQQLVTDGRTLLASLKTVDADQELKRYKNLPDKVKDFYEAKGTLYLCLKTINDAGQSLHADRPELAHRFNLKIMHRHAGQSQPAGDTNQPVPETPKT